MHHIANLKRYSMMALQATAAARSEEKIKSRGEVTKYARDFLMKFAEVSISE